MRAISLLFLSVVICTGAMAQKGEQFIEGSLPQGWGEGDSFNQTMPPDDVWWENFEDPVLDSLIVVACKENISVLVALENIKKARAAWHKAQGGLMPDVGLNLGWQRAKTSGNTAQSLYRETWEGYYSAAASVKWQADVFGSIYMRSRAQKMLFMATEEEYRGVMVSLVANVAITYFSLRESLAEMQVLRWNVESQREIMDITVSRYESGLASKLDVAQARSVYYSTMAKIPAMQATIESYRNAMAVLLGKYPQELAGWLEEGYALPEYMETLAVGVPAMLLLRRPSCYMKQCASA